MSKFKKIIIITVSLLLTVITIFTIILCFVNNDMFKLVKYAESNYNIDIEEVINDYYEIEEDNIIYYKKTIKLITSNFSEEQAIDIVNNYSNQKVSIFDKYSILFRYSKFGNKDKEIKYEIEEFNNPIFLESTIKLIYDLDNRLDNYTDDELIVYEKYLIELSNVESINDISLVKLKELSNFIGYLTYDLTELNYVVSHMFNCPIIEELSETTNLLSFYLKELSSDDVLDLIDILREEDSSIVIYFLNLIYSKYNELELSNLYNEFNLLFSYLEIVEINLFNLSKYLYENDINKYSDIIDENIKNDVYKIIFEMKRVFNSFYFL